MSIPREDDVVSVIIAAHNEEAVIGGCLDALLGQRGGAHLEIIVSANGCTDRTAQIAAERGVTVVDRAERGKSGALNAGDSVARSFPRVYLDADIVVPPDGIQQILGALKSSPTALAVVPRRRIDTRGRPLSVKAYFAINERLPAFENGLFGRGMIMLSERGRSRFADFPPLIADDLFVDSLFSDAEKAEAVEVEVVVDAPYRTKDLLGRLVRVRRGNGEMRRAADAEVVKMTVRPSDKWAWLREVVVPEPRLALAALPYVAITVLAGVLARRPGASGWGRDDSTRTNQVGDGYKV
jgi:glycosyltransferase involved in cell wall biosynthesis